MQYVMKNIFKSALILTGFVMAWSCGEKNLIEKNQQWEFVNPENTNLKVISAYTSNIPVGAPGVGVTRFYIYQNGVKLNGNAIGTAGSWPGPATYASVIPGTSKFDFVLDRRVGNDYGKPVVGDTTFKGSQTFEKSKYYSLFMIGASPTQELYSIEDKITNPKEGFYHARFGNLAIVPAAKSVDVYSRREKKVIASNIAFKSFTDFVELPVPTISDTLDIRDVGTTKVNYSFNTFLPTSRRVYTFYTYGRATFTAERVNQYINK